MKTIHIISKTIASCGVFLAFCLAGRSDYEFATSQQTMSMTTFYIIGFIAISAMLIGLLGISLCEREQITRSRRKHKNN